MDALRAVRGAAGGGGLGMPPPEKYRSGHLRRSSVPLRTSTFSASDVDESSDADEEEEAEARSGSRYSVDSSPARRDDLLPRRTAVPLYRYANVPAQPQHSYYSSDGYSDLSSSRDTALPRAAKPRPQAQQQAYAEEEEYSDSASSSEFSSQAARRSNGIASKGGGYASEYSHTGPARREVSSAVPKARVAAAHKPSNPRNYQQDRYSAQVPAARAHVKSSPKMDIPSAPPIHDYSQEPSPAPHCDTSGWGAAVRQGRDAQELAGRWDVGDERD